MMRFRTRFRNLSRPSRDRLLLKVERVTELPLLVLSFMMVPILLGPFLWEMSAKEEAAFLALDTFIWAAFAIDLGVKLVIAPNRVAYARSHWLDILVVALPFARPLRIVRIIVFGSRAFTGARRLTHIDFLLVYGIGFVLIGATVITTVESGVAGASIGSFPEALWWSVVTVTTVGYGDFTPVTTAGRAVAFVLMIGGIGFFSGVTANLASFFVKEDEAEESESETAQQLREIRELRAEVALIRDSQTGGSASG